MKPLALLLVLLLAGAALAADMVVGRFSAGDLAGWETREFRGKTTYQLVSVDGRRVLHAKSRATASGLFKEVAVDLAKRPLLRWSWKVAGVVAGGDARTKAGDDFAARVYVVFPGAFPWQTRALNYVWANRLPQGRFLPSAYTERSVVIAVQSGPDMTGRWLREERNVYEDYQRAFGGKPPAVGAVGLMTDSDNTGSRAEAYYGDISFALAP